MAGAGFGQDEGFDGAGEESGVFAGGYGWKVGVTLLVSLDDKRGRLRRACCASSQAFASGKYENGAGFVFTRQGQFCHPLSGY